VTLGLDQFASVRQTEDVSFSSPSDTGLALDRGTTNGFTAAYNTTLQVPLATLAKLVLTLGVDESHSATTGFFGGSYAPLSVSTGGWNYSQSQAHEHGGFLQSQLGLGDALFLTYGLRAVYNPNIGRAQNPNLEPTYGVAYTRDLVFGITAKVRTTYGTSTRPPGIGEKDAVLDPYTGSRRKFVGRTTYDVLANPDLVPSSQQGGEGGLELYVGNRGSLQITRYNQTVDHLVVRPIVDSVDLLPEWRAFYGAAPWQYPFREKQNINIGSVRNQGWEGTGTLNVGVFTATGTYSWNKSRLLGITPKYRNQFPQYVVGAPFALIPEHTYAFGLAYVHGGTRIGYNLQGQGRLLSDHDFAVERTGNYSERNKVYRSRAVFPDIYAEMGPGYWLSDLNLSHQFSAHLEGLVQINNVTNSYQSSERNPFYAQAGRVTGLGLRLR
jgi:outer membrane receptor for ferrienterochelin and colicin